MTIEPRLHSNFCNDRKMMSEKICPLLHSKTNTYQRKLMFVIDERLELIFSLTTSKIVECHQIVSEDDQTNLG